MNTIHLIYHFYNSTLQNSLLIIFFLIAISIIIIVIYLEKKFKRINNNLLYREGLFNSLCSNIDDVFIIYDLINHKFEFMSPNFEKVFGINGLKFCENPYALLEYISADRRDEIYEKLTDSSIKSNMEIDFEYNHPILNQKRWMVMRIYPTHNHNNVIWYNISILDATKNKESQMEVNEALINVQKANEAKKEFLTHMSHELKTPINAIIGMTQIASKSLSDAEKIESCLDKINYASQNLLDLINNILEMSKLDYDKLLLVRKPFQLYNLLISYSAIMNSQAEVNKQKFNLIINDKNMVYVIGDDLRLMQIISNCLSNSFKFTPPGGKINLEVSEIAQTTNQVFYRFKISDTGKGMSEDYIERIFIPFDQEDSTIALQYGGTGLGMSIAKNLVVLMGGTIQVASKIGIGTSTTIDIAFDLPAVLLEKSEAEQSNSNSKEYECKDKRVLVVEDNAINLEITSEFLKYLEINVETALNGYEALNLFEASEPGYYDVILMDLQMPGLNGYETTKVLRSSSHPDAKKICIIAMTADDFTDDNLNFNCGMNYQIAKPIDMDKFNSIMQYVISKKNTLY